MVLPGFNTDFKYRGETYHVQTEDNGVANPVVVSLLYHKGAILASKRTSYRELLGGTDFQKPLMDLMKTQHKDLMRDLLAGAFDQSAGISPPATPHPTPVATPAAAPRESRRPSAAAAPAPPASLDEAIMRYLQEHAGRARAAGASLR